MMCHVLLMCNVLLTAGYLPMHLRVARPLSQMGLLSPPVHCSSTGSVYDRSLNPALQHWDRMFALPASSSWRRPEVLDGELYRRSCFGHTGNQLSRSGSSTSNSASNQIFYCGSSSSIGISSSGSSSTVSAVHPGQALLATASRAATSK